MGLSCNSMLHCTECSQGVSLCKPGGKVWVEALVNTVCCCLVYICRLTLSVWCCCRLAHSSKGCSIAQPLGRTCCVQSQRQQWRLHQPTAAAGRMKPFLSCLDELQQGPKAVTDSMTVAESLELQSAVYPMQILFVTS